MATKNSGSNGSSQQKEDCSPLEKLFQDQLKDIYYAEQQLLKALDEMQSASTTEELEDSFAEHRKQTERHVKRLEKVFEHLGMQAQGKKCEAIEGLIREAKTIINETKSGTMTRDAGLIIAAQKVEHYEIATYGGLLQLAITLGKNRAADLLEKTLLEEEQTDRHLTHIAESCVNFEAEEEDERNSSRTWMENQKNARSAKSEEEEPEMSASAF